MRQFWPEKFIQQGNFWWWGAAVFLTLLAFDEIFMIHENLSHALKIEEVVIFLSYAVFLVFLVYIRRSDLSRISISFFLLFVTFSGTSVIADTLSGEGLVDIFGIEIGFEQLAETAAALTLSCMFASIAAAELLIINSNNK